MVVVAGQIESEFPQILDIRASLVKYVFEPNAQQVRGGAGRGRVCTWRTSAAAVRRQRQAAEGKHVGPLGTSRCVPCPRAKPQKDEVRAAVREMRGR